MIRLAPNEDVAQVIIGHLVRVDALEGVRVIRAGISKMPGDGEYGAIYVELEGFDRKNAAHAEVGDEMTGFARGPVDSIPDGLTPLQWMDLNY